MHPRLEITFLKNADVEGCVTVKPDSTGKDALLNSDNPSANLGDHPDFPAMAWTNGGNAVTGRGIIEFDLPILPANTSIYAANLSLHSYNSPLNGSHSTISGSNESVIQLVTENWNESTVTWDNQPNSTTLDQVTLPQSTSSIQHYHHIDVSELVAHMYSTPSNYHGFLFKLVTEQYYRNMLFASGDNDNPLFYPELDICYVLDLPVKNTDANSSFELDESIHEIKMEVFPNPAPSGQTIN